MDNDQQIESTLQKANLRLLKTVELYEMIARGKPYEETLTALVRFIESQVPGMICTVLLLDEEGRLWTGAAPNLPPGLSAAIDGSSIGPCAGSCGTAAYRGENVFVKDIATDPLWNDYKNVFLLRGLRACWSSPIFDEKHRVLGTFAMYYSSPALPAEEHLELFGLATKIGSTCLRRKLSEEQLQRSERQLNLIYSSVSDPIFLLEIQPDFRFRIVSANKAFLTAAGMRAEQVVGKEMERVLPPSSHQLVLEKYRQAIQEKSPVRWDETREVDGRKKTAMCTATPVFNEGGVCTNLVVVAHEAD